MTRCTVHYAGRVQGVGFRATAAHIARAFTVTGFVRNLSDGQVELVSEGEADEVARFLDALDERMKRRIEKQTRRQGPATGEFETFEIRYA